MFLHGALSAPAALAAVAGLFYQRGWMAGTAGNLSCRETADADVFWISASGKSKGWLTERDFVLLDINDGGLVETPVSSNKASAEAAIHRVIYRLFPSATACFHVHSVDACLISERVTGAVVLPALEMLKGLGIWLEAPQVELPVFENSLQVETISQQIEQQFTREVPQVPALLIRQHGITVWGDSLEQCFNRVEITEFLLSYLARA